MSELKKPPSDSWTVAIRYLLVFGIFVLCFYTGTWFELCLSTLNQINLSSWPTTGIGIGLLLCFGPRYWPAIALGALVANVGHHVSIEKSALFAIASAVEAFAGARIFAAVLDFELRRANRRTDSVALLIAIAVAAALGATLAGLTLSIGADQPWLAFNKEWGYWWSEGCLGALVIVPLFRTLATPAPKPNFLRLGTIVAVGVALVSFIFFNHNGLASLFLIYPFILLCVLILEDRDVRIILTLIYFAAISANHSELGNFTRNTNLALSINVHYFFAVFFITAHCLLDFNRAKFISLFHGGIFVLGWGVSTVLFIMLFHENSSALEKRFTSKINFMMATLHERLHDPVISLTSGAGLFATSALVTRDEWKTFSYEITSKYIPHGVRGLGVIFDVSNQRVPDFIHKQQADKNIAFSYQAFAPHDPKITHAYLSTYIEPYLPNRNLIGQDHATEAIRRSAAEQARDTGEMVISDLLYPFADSTHRNGFFMYMPIYVKDSDHSTLESRRQNLLGWIYAPIIADELFSILEMQTDIAYSISYQKNSERIRETESFDTISKFNNEHLNTVTLGGKRLNLHWRATDALMAMHITPLGAPTTSVLLTLLVASLAASLTSVKRQALNLANQKTKELMESEQRWKFSVEGTGDGIWDWNINQNRIYYSKQYKEMLGYDTNELGTEFNELRNLIHPDDFAKVSQDLADHLKNPHKPYYSEHRVLCKDGSHKWVLDRGLVVAHNADNSPQRMIGTQSDISRRKLIESNLELKTARLQKLVQGINSSALVYITNTEGFISFVNEKFCQVSGYSSQELLGTTTNLLKSGIHPKEFYTELWRTLGRGDSWEGEFCNRCKNGSLYWVKTSISQTLSASGEKEFLAVSFDVTKEKEQQAEIVRAYKEAEHAAQAKSDFLSTMSHEIRTPLNAIIGMAHLTLDTPLNDDQKENLSSVKHAADALLTIVNDILDFAKIDAGKMELEFTDFNLATLIEDCRNVFAFAVQQKKLRFDVEIKPDVPRRLLGDAGKVRQVLLNLVNNAIKFTPSGQIILRVSLMQSLSDKNVLRFEIIDSGIGIPKAALSKLFKPFNQLNHATTRSFGGTGLGLSISKSLVELMKGQIGVASEPNQGSTFWFKIPFALAAQTVLPLAAPLKVDTSPKSGRILVAEDNIFNQKVAVKGLQKYGYTVDVAANGIETIDSLNLARYDLILMDCQMPEMDGFEATRLIRNGSAFIKNINKIPIIAMTANAIKGDREKCLAAGMDDYISKPVDFDLLIQKIEAQIKRQEA